MRRQFQRIAVKRTEVHASFAALALVLLSPVLLQAQNDPLIRARPDFQNQLYDPAPSNAPATSLEQPRSIALFSGSAGAAGDARTPSDGQATPIYLTQSGIGQAFFAPASSNAAPSIVVQVTNQIVAASSNATFVVVASGTEPVTYQWFRNGTVVPGATNATLTFANAQPANAGNYFVVVSNVFGTVTSQVATLTVQTMFVRQTNSVVETTSTATTSVTWGDYDNDGRDDILLVRRNIGNTLLRNNGDGTFQLINSHPLVSEGGNVDGATWGDYNNDGLLDVAVAKTGTDSDTIFTGTGGGAFSAMSLLDGASDYSSVWVDVDNDGWLDLHVLFTGIGEQAIYRNNRNGTFSYQPFPAVNWQSGPAWGDFNGDGFMDVFSGSAFGGGSDYAALLTNDTHGGFATVLNAPMTGNLGVVQSAFWADYDNDGDLDLIVGRGSYQPPLVYRNNGTNFTVADCGSFTADTFGLLFFNLGDFDNDGWLDVIGRSTDLQQTLVYHNNGDGTFTRYTNNLATEQNVNSVAFADYDGDGFLDLATSGNPNRLFHNEGNSNAWLKVRLVGTASNRSAIGAKVRARATLNGTNVWQLRQVVAGNGWSQNSLVNHFGLGDATNIDLLRIEWPSGIVQTFSNVAPRQFLTIPEQTTFYFAVNGSGSTSYSPVKSNYFIGEPITLTATPRNTNWTRFLRWSDGNTNATRTITVGLTNVLTALFTNTVAMEELVFQQWEHSYGGDGFDAANSLQQTADGGYIMGGTSGSGISGNKTSTNAGAYDFWLLKLDAAGEKIWERTYGGTNFDWMIVVRQTPDGGYLLGGSSYSAPSGNKTSPYFGGWDFWVLKTDVAGNKVWEKSFGGTSDDLFRAMVQTDDGGCIIGGSSLSGVSGNKVVANPGGAEAFWVLRLDAQGNKVWERAFGGGGGDALYTIRQTLDGGIMLGGPSPSEVAGDKTSPHFGLLDYWLIRLDSHGNKIWDRTFGGLDDDLVFDLHAANDSGIVLGGSSKSGSSGNKTSPNLGGSDFWLVKTDSNGNKLWDRSFGGATNDVIFNLAPWADGGFLAGGGSLSSPGGSKTAPHYGDLDIYLVRVDANGNQLWDKTLGGTNREGLIAAQVLPNGGLVLGAISKSPPGGTKTSPNYGDDDFWVIKLATREAPMGTPLVLVNGLYSPSNSFTFTATNSIQVTLQSTFTNGFIFYTLDGSEPDSGAQFYSGPFMVNDSVVVRAVAYDMFFSPPGELADPVNITVLPLYNLTTSTPGGGTISNSTPTGPYPSNSVVTLTALPLPDWSFLYWTGDAEGTAPVLQLTMNNHKTVQAIFGTGLATTNTGSGSVLREPVQGPYPFGSSVRLTAFPEAGRYFNFWTDAASGNVSPLEFIVTNANRRVIGVFATLTGTRRSLTTLVRGNGSVTNNPQLSFYTNNATVMITATPRPGSFFVGWSGDASGGANPLSVVMNTNKTIAANFAGTPANFPPSVAIVTPSNGVTFVPPATITINAAAIDDDGTVSAVEFFAGTNLLASVTESPFRFAWSNVLAGSYTLSARAADNLGATAISAPVSITVATPTTNPPVFRLSLDKYPVNEGAGAVSIVVLKSEGSGAGTVHLLTGDGLARTNSPGAEDYLPVDVNLSFSGNETSKTILIPIVEDGSLEGTESFFVYLDSTGAGGLLGTPSTAEIEIRDNETSQTNSVTQIRKPDAPVAADSSLLIVLEPAQAGGQWRFIWERAWRDSGVLVPGLPAGNYDIEFKPLPDYQTPPALTVPLPANAQVARTNTYTLTGIPRIGTLTVHLEPPEVAGATNEALRGQWRRQGETGWRDSDVTVNTLNEGTHIVEFKPVAGWSTPASRAVAVFADQGALIDATYLVEISSGGSTPSPVARQDVIDSPDRGEPYAFCGQISSAVGFGSGFIVRERVALTAAHVVFNDTTLSYVGDVRWFFQRDRALYEAYPQTPRGWYVFDGYASRREEDRTNGLPPGVSSARSQMLDVAALYFLEAAGRQGFGGYLTSDVEPNPWLSGTGDRLLAGYPVEIVAEPDRGRLHKSGPFTGGLAQLEGFNRLYTTTEARGYPGMSGGPLCVRFTNGVYFPAAIFLGGSGQTVVRTIDGAVVDLINRAVISANSGENNNGGGVITIIPRLGTNTPISLGINLGPASAISAGGAWRMRSTNANFGSLTNFRSDTGPFLLPSIRFTVEFRDVPGYFSPTSRTVTIVSGQTTIISPQYQVEPPVLGWTEAGPLGILGTVGTRYRLEYVSDLSGAGNWISNRTVTLSNGVMAIPGTAPVQTGQRFYRAVWLP